MAATKDQASFNLKTADVIVEVTGKAESVQQVYQALQGVVNSLAPNTLSGGGNMTLSVKGTDKPDTE